MKKIIIAMSIVAVSLMATNYQSMTFDELNALRGTVATEDREAFRTEMRSRIDAMSETDRNAYIADRGMIGKGNGVQDGSGSGSQGKGGARDGTGRGAGGGGAGNGLAVGGGGNQGGGNR